MTAPIIVHRKTFFAVFNLSSLPCALMNKNPAYTRNKTMMGREICTTTSRTLVRRPIIVVLPSGFSRPLPELIGVCPVTWLALTIKGNTSIIEIRLFKIFLKNNIFLL
tara:strand:+ start:347 stop:670 length:324 start_codon:yes stop_codon:yes gene_type:complete